MLPESAEVPAPLPADLPAKLAIEHKIALFLDYDGTISEITPDVANARPVPGAPELIERLASRDRFQVALISGRQVETLVHLLGVRRNVTYVGNHGLQIMRADGSGQVAIDPQRLRAALDAVRIWLRANVPANSGFVVEDKYLGVALHYRLAEPMMALAICRGLEGFVGTQSALAIRNGKMVIEAVPREANKGDAVCRLMRESGEGRLAVYFGDDLTDEDAIAALAEMDRAVSAGVV
jgi:trehalose 6-phosphate phosphatase